MSIELSRRALFGAASSLALAGLAPRVAKAQFPPVPAGFDAPDAVLLNFNENPHGPFPQARLAAIDALPNSGRYLFARQRELAERIAELHGLRSDMVAGYAGSGVALDMAALAFTSKQRGLVQADPTFESVAQTASAHGAKVTRIPLLADGAHDVEAMAKADKRAGLIYVCNPNNPTGSVTPRERIQWLLAHKPRESVLLIDEAYIHFSDEPDCMDMVRDGADVIVLRTFSKIYGMAGMRLGYACARPDLLQKLVVFGMNSLPVASIAAGMASLSAPEELARRKRENRATLDETVAWLQARGYDTLPSQANCFTVDVKTEARAFAAKMAEHKVFIGRSWPIWPTKPRITVGTAAEMARFREAFAAVTA